MRITGHHHLLYFYIPFHIQHLEFLNLKDQIEKGKHSLTSQLSHPKLKSSFHSDLRKSSLSGSSSIDFISYSVKVK